MKKKRFLHFLKRPVAILAFVFFIAGMLFYWFGYRPVMIREKCSIAAEQMSSKDVFIYEIYYRHCLRSHGIDYQEPKE